MRTGFCLPTLSGDPLSHDPDSNRPPDRLPLRPRRDADGPPFRRAMRAALGRPADATRACDGTRERGLRRGGAGIPTHPAAGRPSPPLPEKDPG
jgi:hypothetical protein